MQAQQPNYSQILDEKQGIWQKHVGVESWGKAEIDKNNVTVHVKKDPELGGGEIPMIRTSNKYTNQNVDKVFNYIANFDNVKEYQEMMESTHCLQSMPDQNMELRMNVAKGNFILSGRFMLIMVKKFTLQDGRKLIIGCSIPDFNLSNLPQDLQSLVKDKTQAHIHLFSICFAQVGNDVEVVKIICNDPRGNIPKMFLDKAKGKEYDVAIKLQQLIPQKCN